MSTGRAPRRRHEFRQSERDLPIEEEYADQFTGKTISDISWRRYSADLYIEFTDGTAAKINASGQPRTLFMYLVP